MKISRSLSCLFISILILSTHEMSANTSIGTPDFAFPQKVSTQASKELKTATRKGDGPGTLRAIMNYGLAQGCIDNDNLPAVLSHINNIQSNKHTSGTTRAMLSLLEANIYNQIYRANRRKFDSRELALTPTSEDYTEWSGVHFRSRIQSLIDSALTHQDELKAEPIGNWMSVIDLETDAKACFPTLYDFVAYQSISLLSTQGLSSVSFSPYWLCRRPTFIQLQFRYTSPIAIKILNLYKELLRVHASDPDALIYADVQRINFVKCHISDDSAASQSQFDLLKTLYSQYLQQDFSGYILQSANDIVNTLEQKQWLYDAATAYLKTHPSSGAWQSSITSISKSLTHQSVTADYRGSVVPGGNIVATIHSSNTESAKVGLYRLPDDKTLNRTAYYRYTEKSSKPVLIATHTIRFNNRHKVFEADTTLIFTVPEIGRYVIMPILNGNEFPTQTTASIIRCSGIALLSGTNTVIATNPITGAPISDVSLRLSSYQHNTLNSLMTNNAGWAPIPKTDRVNYILGVKGNDSVAVCDYNSWQPSYSNEWTYRSNIYTDLPLYHPGDTVRFATIVYKYDKSNRNLCNNLTATAILRDTNNQQIDTLLLCTDEYGRAEGAFVVPKDGLTGTFRISIKNQEHKLNDVQPFKVSDYKLPTFEIRGLIAKQDSPSNGDVTISGEAITYSGFQVANATIQLSLSVSKRLWWRQASTQSFYALEHATDSIGKFSIVLPNELLCDAPIVNGTFTADIVITNTSGESQSASIKFTQGARYSIEAAFSSCLDISSNRISLPIRTIDAMGTAVFSHVSYTLSDDSDVVKSGSFDTATPTVDWHDVASGKYTLTLTNDTDTTSVNDLVLYRIADNIPPIETPLWVPITELTAPCGSIASIRYGTTNKSAHIMVIVSDNDSIISRQWQAPKPGNHTFNVTVPKTGMPLHVTFITVCDYTFTSKTVSITASDVAQNLCIDIESFRDHITPGESEKWNITVTDNLGTPQSSAVMLDMYAKAIDRLASANWQFIAAGYPQRWRLSFSAPQSFKTWSTTNNSDAIRLKQNTINIPGWQLYGQSFIGSPSGLRVLASRKFTAANMAQTTAISGTYTDAGATETAKAESADTTDAEAVQDDTDNSTTSYRMPELPIAIFEPRLTTDAQGRLLYSFTAPNANTTWRLSVLAISPNLLSGSTIRDIVSNKPIMVQPNMPRFLRTGDCATIRASVMNNTDSTATVTTLVEVFDPASGAIINSSSAIDTIAPNSSIIVGTEVTAPECPMIGYRIRSTAGHYTDGEQSIITILPSSTPIIDAEPFYIAPNEKEFAKQLPNMPGNANVTLQFCENPAWYCATALPGLRSDDANSALSASAAIFSAAIADGLLKSSPVLAHTIRSWQVSDKNDSTLTSMLSRNAELKTVLLNATPWMMDAGSQTERMTRLALLFDKNEMAATYSKCIKLLTKLQRNDGGWSWVEQSHDSSPWITYNVLGMMGRLKQLGWLPNNKELNVMIEKAVAYIDDINARNYAKYPHADYTTYVITRDYFPDIQQPSTAKRVTTSTVQRLISEWQTQSVTDKAVSALILNNHNYNASAKQILASLREYAKTTAEQGMWWPSLDSYTGWAMGKIGATALILEAFSSVDANCSDIDLIRQWLILQKEAKDWGTSVTTSNVIAAILHTGTQWIVPAHTAKVLIGTYEIDMTQADNATGYIRTNISALHPSGKTLSITKEPTGPAWGAVYYRFTGTMSKVKAQHCEAVSIDKKLLVRHITPTGFVWEESDSLQLGDKVKVQLTIHASRDMDYVAIIDDRAAALEPVEQLPEPIYSDGICFYRENRDSSTRIFITHLPKGTYILDYELYTNTTGVYSSGIATLQSQYAPQLTAHSAGQRLNVVE